MRLLLMVGAFLAVVHGQRLSRAAPASNAPSAHLHLSAVVNTRAFPYDTTVECWELTKPLRTYPTVGRVLDLGDVSNASYVVLPPRSAEGWHRPPHPMFFVLLSGMAVVKTPVLDRAEAVTDPRQHDLGTTSQSSSLAFAFDSLYVMAGINSLIIAVDTNLASPGHLTFYPSDTESIALQIPFFNGEIPEHKVVHHGPCRTSVKE